MKPRNYHNGKFVPQGIVGPSKKTANGQVDQNGIRLPGRKVLPMHLAEEDVIFSLVMLFLHKHF
jgi:hypothetical protein